ncbi:MAG TPA: DUF4872 domain-containing protein [Chloroflexi bacterium]|nr:DUF4872 domain-containing protein [Chloroflexota bacterium]
MYSRFLREAAEITGDTLLSEIAAEFQRIGERWTEVAQLFRQAAEAENPIVSLILTSLTNCANIGNLKSG